MQTVKILTLALLGSAAVTVPSLGQNLVKNGSFDSDWHGWSRSHKSPTDAITVEPREAGGHCVRLSCSEGTVDLVQPVTLETGQDVVFQVDMKRTAAGPDIRAFLVVRRKNGRDDWCALGAAQTVLNRWEHMARVLRPRGDMVSARVLLMNRLEGATAWFDNVQVVAVSDTSGSATGYAPKVASGSLREAPTIDGTLSPGEWDGAARIEAFGLLADGARPEASTSAWIAHDSTHLYIAAQCSEPAMAEARGAITGHDVGGIFADEVVEIFLDPDNDHETYYHFAIGAGGADYDASHGEGTVSGVAYESGWTARASRGDTSWSVEAAIPFSAVAAANSARIWGLNLCRERHAGGRKEISAWVATGTSFHMPARFGDVVFAESPSTPPVSCDLTQVSPLSPGPAQLEATLISKEDDARQIAVTASIAGPDGTVQTARKTLSLDPGETHSVQLPFQIDQRGTWQAVLSCADADTGATLFSGGSSRFVVPEGLRARVISPWYRGRIFSKMNLKEIDVEARLALRTPQLEETAVQAILKGQGVERAATARPAAAETAAETILTIPCADLPDGEYKITVRLLDQEDREQARVEGLTVSKLPTAPQEVWFDRQNNLWINGKAHVPTGFYSLDWAGRIGEAAEGGYTLYHTYASQSVRQLNPETSTWKWQTWLDAGAEHGMRAFMGIGYRGDGEKDADGKPVNFLAKLANGEKPEARNVITQFIDRWKTHPAIAAWYLYDEPSLAGRTVEEIRTLYDLADAHDPYHPKVICQVFWTDPRFVPFLDVLMPDPYPIRAEQSRPLRTVADAVRAARRTVNDEKPVWPVLQWYQYPGGRYPTPEEMRCMAFLSVAAGAKGMTWYGFYHGYKGDKQHWPDVARIGRELRACEDVILAPYADEPVVTTPRDAPLETMAKRTGDTRHLILVNYEERPLRGITIHLDANAASAVERLSGDTLTVDNGALTLDFAAYEPKVIDIVLK